jgi:flagellar hook-length control protein FliK
MTVQSIDKRVVPEANMTPAGQDKQQGALSPEDAFVALLSQTSQRFSNKLAGSTSATTVLANHFARKQAEPKAEKAQPARDDAPQARPAIKDSRSAAKAEKPRQADDAAPAARKTETKDAGPAKTEAADETGAVAATDDAPAATSANDDGRQDGQAAAQPQDQESGAVAVVAQPEAEIKVEVAVLGTEAAVVSDDAAQDPDALAEGDDPLAGLGKDDRKRVLDLEKRIVADLEAGDTDDALEAATELVDHLIRKAGQQQADAGSQMTGQSDLMRQQAADLAERLADTGTRLDIKVQTNTQATSTVEAAATVTESFAQMDLALQGQAEAEQSFDPSGRQQGGQAGAETLKTATPTQSPATAATAQAPEVVADIRTFSAALAAQVDANAKVVDQAPEQRPVTALAGIGATQAADKPAQAQAAQAPRAPRVPLQQQVMEQINVHIDKAVKDGVDTVKIQLKPLDLGKIEIKLEMVDGRVSATVTADKPETLALLQRDSKGLEKALEDAGLKPDGYGTSFNLRGEHQNNADRGGDHQRAGRNRGNGGGLAGEDVPAGLAEAAQPRRANGRSGVDISV